MLVRNIIINLGGNSLTFEQKIAILSLFVSALAIVFPYISVKSQLSYKIKKDKDLAKSKEQDLCAEFIGYCKKAHTFGLTDEDICKFTQLYAKLHLISNSELRNALISLCDAIITNKAVVSNELFKCLDLYKKCFKNSLR